MSLISEKTAGGREYKVQDISLSDLGCLEINQAELMNSGLRACRIEFGSSQPIKGAKITLSLPITSQTAVFINTLISLGAEVRCCSSSISATEDHIAAAIARDSAAIFAWKDQTLPEYWWCIERALDWSSAESGGCPDLIFDHGSDLTLLIQEGVKAEKKFETTGELPDPFSSVDFKFQIMLRIIRNSIEANPKKFTAIKQRLVASSEEIATRIKICYPSQSNETMSFQDSVQFGDLYGYRFSLLESLRRTTDFKIAGKIAAVFGYGEIGRGCAAALKQTGARVVVIENIAKNILHALSAGLEIVNFEDVVSEIDIFVTTTGNKNPVITVPDMKKMKNNAILCSMGQFDCGIDMAGLENVTGVQQTTMKPRIDNWIFPDTNSGIIVLSEGRPLAECTGNIGISGPFTDQMIAEALEHFAAEEQEETGMISTAIRESTEEWTMRKIEALDKIEAEAAAGKAGSGSVAELEEMESELGLLKATIRLTSNEMGIISEGVDNLVATVLGLD